MVQETTAITAVCVAGKRRASERGTLESTKQTNKLINRINAEGNSIRPAAQRSGRFQEFETALLSWNSQEAKGEKKLEGEASAHYRSGHFVVLKRMTKRDYL